MRTLFFLAVLSSFAFSHALHLFATQEGDKVEIYSYFYKNSPCMDCEVLISADGREILRTRTDKEGLASIRIPAKNFTIQIYGGAGHGAQMEFSAEDFTPQNSGDPENSTPQNSDVSKNPVPQNLNAAKNSASEGSAPENIAPKASTPENKISSASEPLENSASQSISPKESSKSDIRSMAFQSQSAEAPKIALCLALIFGFFALMWLAKRARK
ncbi:MAG: hypothetical protein ACFNVQ_02795 [Campylobacter sp.]|uniref:hypothetical protein n=1 Tax=uncultured Campylobacter sp. TaxID=218934 RepID=UPI00263128C2|nr:hypothetical protein [uncultured Campylobacter sp.]